jgi:hypothetical protein
MNSIETLASVRLRESGFAPTKANKHRIMTAAEKTSDISRVINNMTDLEILAAVRVKKTDTAKTTTPVPVKNP